MSPAEQITEALGGRRAGPGRWLCRCPNPTHGQGKGDRRPSLIVSDNAELRDGVSVHCLAGCEWQAVKAELQRQGFLDDRPGQDAPAPRRQDRGPPPEPEPNPEALALWRAAQPTTGTLAETYLHSHRGLAGLFLPALRFLPSADYPSGGQRFAALVAPVARPDRKVVAVQLTYLAPNGAKAPLRTPRWTFGALGTGAVRLGPSGDVLGIAEGVETAIAAMQLAQVPVWAALGAHRLAKLHMPRTVREVHVFADNDAPGQVAADKAAERHTAEGRRVVVRYPPDGCKDWADLILMRARRQAA
jgi:putative DNA primase/helicase